METVDGARAFVRHQLRRRVEHLEEPLARGERLLRGRRDLRQLLQRLQQSHHDDEEGDQLRRLKRVPPTSTIRAPIHRIATATRRSEKLGDWLRQESDARDAHQPVGVAIARLEKPALLVRLGTERLDEPNAGHRFLQHARHLAVVVAEAAIAATQPLEQGLQRANDERRDDERDERERQRGREQHGDIRQDERRALKRLRDERRDDVLHLRRIGDDTRDDLTDFRAREEAERKALQVRVHGVADVARHVLLQLRAEIAGEPDEEILERDRCDDDENHNLQ